MNEREKPNPILMIAILVLAIVVLNIIRAHPQWRPYFP